MTGGSLVFNMVGVVGAGTMGRGIAQTAAQAGSDVWIHDADPPAAQKAIDAIGATWARGVEKGKVSAADMGQWAARLRVAASIADLAPCSLVIETVTERLDVKVGVLRALEEALDRSAVLVTNTSSLSVTALSSSLMRPGQFAGYHFFNPVPLMKIVEVVGALKTSAATLDVLVRFARQLGHRPLLARDTPGFIVNHVGRAFGSEALSIAAESIADYQTIDEILKGQVGFKLGPFELFDLSGLDVSHAIMESVYGQYYQEPRYRPNLIAAQRVAAHVLGRKTGAGFYRYDDEGKAVLAERQRSRELPIGESPSVWISPRAFRAEALGELVQSLGAVLDSAVRPSSGSLILLAPLGIDVTTALTDEQLDPSRTVGIDWLIPDAETCMRVIATNPLTGSAWRQAAEHLFSQDGKRVSVVNDSAGFVTQRVIAMIVAIGADMCQQRICSPADLNIAARLALGYPAGPLELGDRLGPGTIAKVLEGIQRVTGDPRYRVPPWLRRRAMLDASLSFVQADQSY